MRRRVTAGVLAGTVLAALAGCSLVGNPSGTPAARTPGPGGPSGSPSVAFTAPSVPVPAWSFASTPPTSAGPSFPEGYAVSCAGQPSAGQVVALLRTRGVLDQSAVATLRTGPLCAGTWQYTVVVVAGREPLQVVTQGPPTALVLVTAGTDVCSVQVRTQAPAGIVTAANCT